MRQPAAHDVVDGSGTHFVAPWTPAVYVPLGQAVQLTAPFTAT